MARGFRAGEIDLARDLVPQDLEGILRDARFRHGLVETPTSNTYFVLFNCRSGSAVRDDAVRRALSSVVRTSDLVWRTLGRFAAPAVCLIPPGLLGHDPGRRSHPMTPEEARQALAAAGVGPKLQLRASVHPVLKDRYGALLAALRATWAELGVEISIETPDMAAFLDSFEKCDGFDLLIGRWNTDYPDPDNIARSLFHSGTGHYRHWYSLGRGGPASRGRPLGEPTRRTGDPLPEVREPALRNGGAHPALPRHRLPPRRARGSAASPCAAACRR